MIQTCTYLCSSN